MDNDVISQGAEAIIYKRDGIAVKDRIKKMYRLDAIDRRLRKQRTRSEANLLREARNVGVHTPKTFSVSESVIEMELIDGDVVKDILNEETIEDIVVKIGRNIASLHEYDIIHGDLTTSNMILKDSKMYFIDFGLGFHSNRQEDKAIDLYLLHHSIEATHWKILKKLWKILIDTYRSNFSGADKVIKTLIQIEKRGRYKNKTGFS